MNLVSSPSPRNPGISLPCVSILNAPACEAAPQRLKEIPATTTEDPPALIMAGLDDKGKPHASWFAAGDAVAAAADLMDMAVIEVKSDDLAAIAARLPKGKLFESGKAFVPFVKREIYDCLAAYFDEEYVAASAERLEAAAAANAANYAKASQGETAPRQPEDWSKLTVGDRVLASDGPGDGWYEADIQEALPDERFRLRWRDWPELDDFTRGITDIALLHPKHVGA
jgi:hypothetical protein